MVLIHNKKISRVVIDKLIQEIKQKKEFSGMYDNFVETELLKHLEQNRKALQTVLAGKTKSAAYKQIIKAVRAVLRRVYGVFQVEDQFKRKKLLKELAQTKKQPPNYLLLHKKILLTHASTKERLQDYEDIYKKIFAKTGKPKSILDLGCGLNPASIPFMKLKKVRYIASDINKHDLSFIEDYFEVEAIDGKTLLLNLQEIKKKNIFKTLAKVDVCFLFKVLDPLEPSKSHKLSELLIQAIPAKWIIASFATTTLASKKMRFPARGWIERMLKRIGYSFSKFEISNEIFYVIEKPNS